MNTSIYRRKVLLPLCFTACLVLFLFYDSFAQRDSTRYPIAIFFQSHCCGVPDAAGLHKSITDFRRKYKFKRINAVKIAPMGKEGEYVLAFTLKGFTPRLKKRFIQLIQHTSQKLTDKGSATAEENYWLVRSALPAMASVKIVSW